MLAFCAAAAATRYRCFRGHCSPVTSPRRCLIATVAATPDVPTTAFALPLPPLDPPADADAYSVSTATSTALDATVHSSTVVAFGRYMA